MAKRSTTDLSLIVGIDKPAGMSSHDVVNRVRRIFGERRCGHMGTLDPDATGALAVCVGPATRLNALLTSHDKVYEFTIAFGSATDTDDAQGAVIEQAPVPERLSDEGFAREYLAGLVGPCKQMPPAYSAIKVNGKKSYEAARKGDSVELTPRDIEIYSTRLLGIETQDDVLSWRVEAHVSAGTYVRSIARDTGRDLGTCAHVGELRRIQAGHLMVQNCVSLEQLEADPFGSLIDPVKLLGLRFVFLNEKQSADVSVGRFLPVKGLRLFCYELSAARGLDYDSCTSGVIESFEPLGDGESVCLIADNKVAAIYQFDQKRRVLKSRCGFANGVARVGRI